MSDILNGRFPDELSSILNNYQIDVHATSSQNNGNRIFQQDCFLITKLFNGYLFAVCDGQGHDTLAADIVTLNLANIVNDKYLSVLRGNDSELTEIDEKKIFSRVFSELHEFTEDFDSGTTVSLAMVRPLVLEENTLHQFRVTLAVLGDSPVTLFDAGKYLHMPQHSAEYFSQDRQRIEEGNLGHFVDGYLLSNKNHPRYGGLAMTRALGHCDFDDVLLRQPTIEVIDISSDAVIVLATDGILMHEGPEEVGLEMESLIKQAKQGDSAGDILNKVGRTEDNATLLVVSFEGTR